MFTIEALNCAGDFFHAAPNIDHSQDFVRRDIIEWMKWLRTDIGYDGWRLDFVRSVALYEKKLVAIVRKCVLLNVAHILFSSIFLFCAFLSMLL